MNTASETTRTSLVHQAAKASWVSGILVLVVVGVGGRVAPILTDLVGSMFIVSGLICGVSALIGMRTHGTKGILLPALAGICIHGLLAFIGVTNFVAARARALAE